MREQVICIYITFYPFTYIPTYVHTYQGPIKVVVNGGDEEKKKNTTTANISASNLLHDHEGSPIRRMDEVRGGRSASSFLHGAWR